MRVLVTGHRGYIGSVMTAVLRHARYEVVGLDCNFYHGCDFGRTHQDVPCYETDLREIEYTDLLPFDAVVHLAALPVEDGGQLDSEQIREVNEEATARLAECCKQAGVSRLLFASSGNVYGHHAAMAVDERTTPAPFCSFSASKLRCERLLTELADEAFTPVCLRHGHVFGVSPRFRADLSINRYAASAVTSGEVTLHSDGRAIRSVIHVEDLCRVYAAILAAPEEIMHNQVLNVSAPGQDYRLVDIADLVTELIPPSARRFAPELNREGGCRLDVSKLSQALPHLNFRWTLAMGIRQLANATGCAGMTPGDLRSDRYHRCKRLGALLEGREIDERFRRRAACPATAGLAAPS